MWKWFAKRVLPALVLALIFGVGGLVLGLASKIQDDLVSNYFPSGTILFVSYNSECPRGWETMPRTAVMAETTHIAEFHRKLGGGGSTHPSVGGWSFYHPVVCLKE